MTAFERVHAALVNTHDFLRKLQELLDLPFMPKQGLIVADGFEAINEISGEIERLRGALEFIVSEAHYYVPEHLKMRARAALKSVGQERGSAKGLEGQPVVSFTEIHKGG